MQDIKNAQEDVPVFARRLHGRRGTRQAQHQRAVDHRIGVAVGNTLLKQAQPLTIITAATNDDKFRVIAELVGQWEPGLVVVGLPLHPDGAEHAMTVRCRRFANQLHGRFGLETVLIDERYSSAVIAQERGQRIDDVAAAIILQQYFDDHDRS